MLKAGETATCRYLVMRYVDGTPIDAYVRSQPLKRAECVRLFRRICAGVALAHQNHIVHRDLKPGNILIRRNSDPCILDFGLAFETSASLEFCTF